jgi:hypothetical protein
VLIAETEHPIGDLDLAAARVPNPGTSTVEVLSSYVPLCTSAEAVPPSPQSVASRRTVWAATSRMRRSLNP